MDRVPHSPDFSALFEGKKRLTAAKGQVFYGPDDEPHGVIFIHEGYVKEYDIDVRGERQLITLTGPAGIVPLFWALDGKFENLFGEAMTKVTYSFMPREEFNMAVNQSVKMLRTVTASLLWFHHLSRLRIQNLELRTAREKVAFRLLFLGVCYGSAGDDHTITMPVTHQDLAEALNITRDTANRVMRDFVAEGLIRKQGQAIVILKPAVLQGMTGGITM